MKELAQNDLRKTRQEFNKLRMMGQTFGPQILRGVNAIINGTNTASTALPTPQVEPTT